MDFTKFINSRDVREHLKNIGYDFNSLEAAWLVWQSDATANEKHKAWEYIISHMLDLRIEEGRDRRAFGSLHTALKNYMDIEREWFYEWSSVDEWEGREMLTVYRIRAFTTYGDWVDVGPVYSNWSLALSYFTKRERNEGHLRYVIIKECVDHNEKQYYVTFTPYGEALSVYCDKFKNEEDFILYNFLFGRLYLTFPTPFKAGDILCKHNLCAALKPYENAFVLTELRNDSYDENRPKAPTDDKTAVYGYFLCGYDSIQVVKDHDWDYMDLEYYRGPMEGKFRALIPFSNYVKGEINEADLCNAYMGIMNSPIGDPLAQHSEPTNGD